MAPPTNFCATTSVKLVDRRLSLSEVPHTAHKCSKTCIGIIKKKVYFLHFHVQQRFLSCRALLYGEWWEADVRPLGYHRLLTRQRWAGHGPKYAGLVCRDWR